MRDTETVSDERLRQIIAHAETVEQWQGPELLSICRELLARRSSPDREMVVKPLEWREESKSWHRAPSALGVYSITEYRGMREAGFKLDYGGGLTSYFNSLEKAQAAAQADYEARILAALEAKP